MSQQQFQDDLQVYERFLMEVLQATAKSKGDAKVIDPLLAANTDKLDNILASLLWHWVTDKFEKVEVDEAEYIAGVICDFGYLIQQFPLGDKASNMEIQRIAKLFSLQM